MDKEDGVHLHNGVLHSRKKLHLEIYMQMDRSSKHHIEWGNLDPERQLQYVLTPKWLLRHKAK